MAGCTLLGSVARAFLQPILLAASLAVLGAKHYFEVKNGSNRSTARFLFDSSKQLAGALWMHILNLLCATALANHTEEDACEWYWIEIMVDTTVGVYVEFLLMQFLVGMKSWTPKTAAVDWPGLVALIQESCIKVQDETPHNALQEPLLQAQGTGANPVDIWEVLDRKRCLEELTALWKVLDKKRYFAQLGAWLIVVSIMKISMLLIMGIFGPQFLGLAAWVLGYFSSYPWLELIFVMILTPVVMDAVQFVLQDSIFIDLDEGYMVGDLYTRKAPAASRRLNNAVLQERQDLRAQVQALTEKDEDQQLEIAALRSELMYWKSGFLWRVILLPFKGVQRDQPGMYRALEVLQTYQEPAHPLRTYTERVEPPGRVLKVLEIREGEDNSARKVVWGKLQKPPEHWILLVDGSGKRCARKLVMPEAAEAGPAAEGAAAGAAGAAAAGAPPAAGAAALP